MCQPCAARAEVYPQHALHAVLVTAQVFFPFAPGIESIYEPVLEEVEEALDAARENLDHMQVSTCSKICCYSLVCMAAPVCPCSMQEACATVTADAWWG